MTLARRKNEPTVDAINLALGVFLFLAPWIFAFSSNAARQNAWYMGTLIAFVAFTEIGDFAEWAEWVNLTIGAWVMGSAWTLGFYAQTTAMRLHLIVGFVVVVSTTVDLYLVHRSRPQDASTHQRFSNRIE